DPRARAPRPRHGRSPALRARERVPADLRPLLRRERQRLRDERPLRGDRLQEKEGREGGQGPARQRGANRRVPEAEEWQAEACDACSRAKEEAGLDALVAELAIGWRSPRRASCTGFQASRTPERNWRRVSAR